MDKVKLLKNRLKSDNDYFASTVNYSSVLANTSLDSKTSLDEGLMHAVLFMNKTAKNLVVSMDELLRELALEVGFNPTDILDEKTFNGLLELYNRNVNVIKTVLNDDFSKLLRVHRNLASSVLGLSPLTSSLIPVLNNVDSPLFSTFNSLPQNVLDVFTHINHPLPEGGLRLLSFITDNAHRLNLLESYTNNVAFYTFDNYSKGKINTDSVTKLNLTSEGLHTLTVWVRACNRYIIEFGNLLSDNSNFEVAGSEHLFNFVFIKEIERFIHCLDLLKISIQRVEGVEGVSDFHFKRMDFESVIKDIQKALYQKMFKMASSVVDKSKNVYQDRYTELLSKTYKALLLLSTHSNQDSTVFLKLGASESLQDVHNNTITALQGVSKEIGNLLDVPERKIRRENKTIRSTSYFIHFLSLKASAVAFDEHLKSEILKAFKRVQ